MKKLNSIIFALIAAAFISCNDDETEPDTQAPTIEINSPSDEAVVNEGEQITLEAEVKDDLALEMVSLSVTPPGGEPRTILLLTEDDFNDNREAAITESFTLGKDLAGGNITFTLDATDKAGNTTTESISVHVLEADRNAPGITIHKPVDEAEFHPDDAITLESQISDDSALDEVTVWVTPAGGLAHLVHTVNPEDYSNEGREVSIEEVISLSSGTSLPGSYTLTLRAADEHGNSTEESIIIHILEVDTHAPSIKIKNPLEGATYYTDEEIAFRAEVIDNVALESVQVKLISPEGEPHLVHTVNPEDFSSENSLANINETISLGTEPVAGEYKIMVTAIDSHENVSEKIVVIYVQEADPKAPTITIQSPTDGSEFSPDGVITLEAGVQHESALEAVTVRLSNPEGETHTVYSLNKEDFSGNNQEATISETISLGTTPGHYTLTIEAADAEGNTSEKSVRVIVRTADTSAPDITIHGPATGAEYTILDAVPIRASITDQSRLNEVTVWLISPDGQSHLAHTANQADFYNEGREAAIEKTISLASGNFAPGVHLVMIRATDEEGNTAEETVSIILGEADTTPPNILVYAPKNGSTYQQGSDVYLDVVVEDDTKLREIHIKVTLSEFITIHEETITEFDGEDYHQVEGTTSLPPDAATGTYKVTITATDAAGNQAIETLTFQVTA